MLRPVKASAVSATNPSFTMQAVCDGLSPIKGKVGEASMTDTTFWNASPTGVVVAET